MKILLNKRNNIVLLSDSFMLSVSNQILTIMHSIDEFSLFGYKYALQRPNHNEWDYVPCSFRSIWFPYGHGRFCKERLYSKTYVERDRNGATS